MPKGLSAQETAGKLADLATMIETMDPTKIIDVTWEQNTGLTHYSLWASPSHQSEPVMTTLVITIRSLT